MHPRTPSPRLGSPRKPKSGFALLITITLLAFLVLLLVSLAGLTRVETQVASNNQQLSQARQNALMALNIALGQLQKTAGPDQRVTARADILTLTDATKSKWTGVWDTTKETATVKPTPVWLVSSSSPTTLPTNVGAAGTLNTGVNASATDVRLVGPASTDTSVAGNEVIVPLAPISATGVPGFASGTSVTIGRYGWWVGDEGVKASFRMTDPNIINPAPSGYIANPKLSTLVVQRQGIERMTGWSKAAAGASAINALRPTDNYYPANTADIAKAFSREQFSLVTPASAPAAGALQTATRQRFHDLTPLSLGVLANVSYDYSSPNSTPGGLKRDLTAGLQPTVVSPNGPVVNANGDNPIFPPTGASASVSDPGGPDWRQLQDYYNLGSTAYVSGSGASTLMNSRIPSDYVHGLFPVMTLLNIGYHVTFTNPSIPGVTQQLQMIVMPTIALWNPYNFDLKNLSNVYVHFDYGRVPNFCAAVWDPNVTGIPMPQSPDPTLPVDPSSTSAAIATIAPNYTTTPFQKFTTPQKMTFMLNLSGIPPIPAGKAIFLRPSGFSALDPSTNTSANVLKVGQTPGYGFTVPMTYTAQKAVTSSKQITFAMNITGTSLNAYFSTNSNSAATQNYYYIIKGMANNYPWGVGRSAGSNNPFYMYKVLSAAAATQPSVGPLGLYAAINAPSASAVANNIPAMGVYSLLNFTMDSTGYQQITRTRWLADHNPRGVWAGRTAYETNSGYNDVANYTNNFAVNYNDAGYSYYGTRRVNLTIDSSTATNPTGDPYVGISAKPFTSQFSSDVITGIPPTQSILFEAPTPDNPVLSIGQLMHANLSRNGTKGDNVTPAFPGLYTTPVTVMASNITPAYAIGNSFRNPRVPDQSTSYNQSLFSSPGGTNGLPLSGMIYDYSYLLNKALWDKYFFSTVPASGAMTYPFQSSPMSLYLRQGETLSTVTTSLRDYQKAASSLLVAGSFNVNSTSVEAWKAVLSSFYGQDKDARSGGSKDNTVANRQHPINRFALAPAQPIDSTQTSLSQNGQTYTTERKLTNTEIDGLANSIVNTIKSRRGTFGPFLSLAAFVNRSIDTAATVKDRQFGVLQQAIDEGVDSATTRTLNGAFNDQISAAQTGMPAINGANTGVVRVGGALKGDTSVLPVTDHSGVAASSGIGPVAANAPGYLSQADILARLGPILTARSDTFVIRTYGEVLNPATNVTTGRAWLEATVQRLPDYVVPKSGTTGDDPATTPATDATNIAFGRKFKVTSFRWLSSNDL